MEIKIPPKTREIIDCYLGAGTNYNASIDMMAMTLYMKASRMMCWHRCKIEGTNEYPMVYAFNFSPSGTYKDNLIKMLDKVSKDIDIEMEEFKEWLYDDINAKINDFVKDLKSKTEKDSFINKHRADKFLDTFSIGTPHGFQKNRGGAEDLGVGHVHYNNSEVLDTFYDKDSKVEAILSLVKNAWTDGDTDASIIIGESRRHVRDVPLTMMLHGSSAGLKENDKMLNNFLKVLETGIAKRTIILFNDKTERNLKDIVTQREYENLIIDYEPELKKHFKKMYDAIKVSSPHLDIKTREDLTVKSIRHDFIKKVIKVSEGAKVAKMNYENDCIIKAKSTKNKIIQIETYDRFWRAFRLSACIVLVEHPEDLVIREEDYNYAKDLVDRWGDQFKKFLNSEKYTEDHKMYDYILDNPGVSRSNIKSEAGLRYKSQVDNLIDNISEIADYKGMYLKAVPRNGITVNYFIKSIPEHKELSADIQVSYSQAQTNTPKDTKYIPYTCYFDEFHKVVRSDRAYSAAKFKNNHRSCSNWVGNDTLLIFDIDNDNDELTLEECKSRVKDYKCLIVTTKSHQKAKNGGIKKDRYRLIFPTTKLEGVKRDKYAEIKELIMKEFGIYEYTDLGASKDPARLFFGHNGKHWYSGSNKMLNWEMYDKPVETSSSSSASSSAPYKKNFYNIDTTSNVPKLDKDYLITLSNKKKITVEEAEKMAQQKGGTIPCYCPNPAHQDKKPSAFFAANDKGYIHFECSGCNTKYYMKRDKLLNSK